MSNEDVAYDPYALPADAVQEPPATTWEALRKIGPGIILAGTIVGSGELILTTGFGAKYGFVFLWLILFSCVIKVFVQIELGRYAISSGRPTLGALQDIGSGACQGNAGSRGNIWLWWWFVMLVCTVFQLGGMTGGVGQALDLAFPQFADGFAHAVGMVSSAGEQMILQRRSFPWAIVACIVTMLLIYGGSYRRIEWLTTFIVVGVTVTTVIAATALGATEYPIRASDLMSGMKFEIPSSGVADAFAIFGITGVGATELFYYPYWCLEKGYARYVGKSDGSEAWERRARGWIRVMHLDAWVSMVVFTLSTVAFYVMGAAVLKPQGLEPQGPKLIETLSEMYVGPFGNWARILFLIGAGAVLFKTLYLACAANSRLTADFLNLVGLAHLRTAESRHVMIRRLCLLFPLFAMSLYILLPDPKVLVKVGGIAQAATLPMIAGAALFFRYRRVDSKLQPLWITDLLLWIAVVSITVVAIYSVITSSGDLFKMLVPPVQSVPVGK
ncbi:MAG: Nramp family divalent metal transporter [Pirellulales bacterium]